MAGERDPAVATAQNLPTADLVRPGDDHRVTSDCIHSYPSRCRLPAACDVQRRQRYLWHAYELARGMNAHILGITKLELTRPMDLMNRLGGGWQRPGGPYMAGRSSPLERAFPPARALSGELVSQLWQRAGQQGAADPRYADKPLVRRPVLVTLCKHVSLTSEASRASDRLLLRCCVCGSGLSVCWEPTATGWPGNGMPLTDHSSANPELKHKRRCFAYARCGLHDFRQPCPRLLWPG